ncbi:Sphingosine-1-phosphate phosphatase, putative [Hondaea fermentalgiana]|uniref:Sphingosine-1-phosphate phosphatase, putative n=1 Tax=Hondaea fermentalgiana TaxID=2315210 RepID=A0A2R5GN15_9STRA|nr:Sphingosine-1-phosphate phosphatase, putative [Hondaea fermentalgiana]|eukprot:GBG31689.1 Sphingosine-1-phosphate phosphatase, putative [Hondaea fermentalgiana]
MQGGRSDNSVLGRWGGSFRQDAALAEGEESSGWESEVEVTQSISIGRRLDAGLHALRTAFALALSLPIAWLCLHPSIASFRERKFRVVETGTQTVVSIQRRLRCRALDMYFQVFSFCAEEEFYLLALPCIIWNIDRVLGRRLTLVICVGLIMGNLAKDVFQLPRPASPPVWRPAIQEAVDSTNLADFGFPSTHSMNSVSNSVFIFLYATCDPDAWDGAAALKLVTDPENRLWIALCLVYIVSLSLSRLYLGAHTPTDLRGGLALGAIWIACFFPVSAQFDRYYLSTSWLSLKLLFAAIILLLLNPQPRPPTPTFLQNALLTGLVCGCILGSRHFEDIGDVHMDEFGNIVALRDARLLAQAPTWLPSAAHQVQVSAQAWPRLALVLRTILGYIIVILLRVIAKTLAIAALSLLGISIKPKVEEIKPEGRSSKSGKGKRKTPRRSSKRVVRLLTRDVDILGNAIVKVTVYATLAWGITCFVPIIYSCIGLGSSSTLSQPSS